MADTSTQEKRMLTEQDLRLQYGIADPKERVLKYVSPLAILALGSVL
jgi:hypothetical protein